MSPGEVISILAVSAADDEISFLEHFAARSRWKVERVGSCAEAASCLEREDVAVVLCSSQLPDGTWKAVIAEAGAHSCRPPVIVMTAAADDRLWSEVLDSGGYDVVAKPLDAREVTQVVSLAWRQWHETRVRAGRQTASS
jgi:DNA-binding response OmpR family regulator